LNLGELAVGLAVELAVVGALDTGVPEEEQAVRATSSSAAVSPALPCRAGRAAGCGAGCFVICGFSFLRGWEQPAAARSANGRSLLEWQVGDRIAAC
jgi:hypothetical protein